MEKLPIMNIPRVTTSSSSRSWVPAVAMIDVCEALMVMRLDDVIGGPQDKVWRLSECGFMVKVWRSRSVVSLIRSSETGRDCQFLANETC